MRNRALIAAGAIVVALGVAATANAAANLAVGSTVEYPPGPGQAMGTIATGSDGNVWYSYSNLTSPGGGLRAMATGSNVVLASWAMPVSLFPLPYQDPDSLVNGPDGRLWFVQGEGPSGPPILGAITTGGTYSAYPLPAGSTSGGVTPGANNDLWVTAGSAIIRSTTGGAFTSYPLPSGATTTIGAAPVVGPDGAIWFAATQGGTGAVGRMTTSGAMQFFPLPLPAGAQAGWGVGATAFTTGPTGVLWATVQSQSPAGPGNAGAVMAIQSTGAMTTVASLPGDPCVLDCTIISAQDGNAWTTGNGAIMRISPAGAVTSYTVVTKPGNAAPSSLAIGPDKNLWFTDGVNGNVGELAMFGGAPIPAPTASMVNGYRGKSATRGKKLQVIFEAGQSAAGQSRITISRRGTTVQLWKGNVRPGTTRTVSGTVPRSFPKGTATVALVTPKSAGKASTTVTVK